MSPSDSPKYIVSASETAGLVCLELISGAQTLSQLLSPAEAREIAADLTWAAQQVEEAE